MLTHARLHAAQDVVVRFDLSDFFAHVHGARALGVFRAAGYREPLAVSLTALCTNRVPVSVLRAAPPPRSSSEVQSAFHLRNRLSDFHLPQGAPTSPALANLAAFGLDVRLEALARTIGATYSRYADDLVFSGDKTLAGCRGRLTRQLEALLRDEGFSLNPAKTRVLPAAGRQQITGIVVNRGVNVARNDFDALKSTLTNCVRNGLEHEARGREHFADFLQGKIAWVEYLNPRRGAKLRALFDRIPNR